MFFRDEEEYLTENQRANRIIWNRKKRKFKRWLRHNREEVAILSGSIIVIYFLLFIIWSGA